jgi:hypothetical protein
MNRPEKELTCFDCLYEGSCYFRESNSPCNKFVSEKLPLFQERNHIDIVKEETDETTKLGGNK